MKWSHLPVAGALYDQDPELLDRFQYIFQERAKHEEKEARDRDRKQASRSRASSGRTRRGR